MRLVGRAVDIYNYLEPLLNDYRKICRRTMSGGWELTTMDQFVEELLTAESACDINLPFLLKRAVMETSHQLQVPRAPPCSASSCSASS